MIVSRKTSIYPSRPPLFLSEGEHVTIEDYPERTFMVHSNSSTNRKSWFKVTHKSGTECLDYGMKIPALFKNSPAGLPLLGELVSSPLAPIELVSRSVAENIIALIGLLLGCKLSFYKSNCGIEEGSSSSILY
jgi:hypothetical protein